MVQDTRTLNRNAVLTELLRSRPISRKLIAANTGISPSTVTRTVDLLIAEGILREGAELVVDRRGRRAVSLDLVADRSYAVGVDLGASNTRLIVADLLAHPVATREVPTPPDLSPVDLAHWLANETMTTAGALWSGVEDVSLGLPGAVNQLDQSVSNAPNLAQVEDLSFLSTFQSDVGRAVQTDNDANYALLGEQRFGAARDTPTAAMLTLGAGLGAGLSIDGRILQGKHGLVGEFGQLPAGPLGTRLEHMVTGPGIIRRAREAGIVIENPAELFYDASPTAVQTLRAHFDQALLIVLTAIAVSCEPETIVFGGGISKSLTGSLGRYQDALTQSLRISPKLTPAALGDFSGAAGAVVASLHAAYTRLGVESDALTDLPAATTFEFDAIGTPE